MGHKDRIIAFDADGVLFDSNNFKKSNIYAAVSMHKGETIAKDFTEEFTKNNGVGRPPTNGNCPFLVGPSL